MALFTDNFTGTDETEAMSAGAGWSAFGLGGNAAVIRSNRCALEGANGPNNQNFRGYDHGSINHFAECVVGTDAGVLNNGALVAVRATDRNTYVGMYYDTDRYRLNFKGSWGLIDSYVTALVAGDVIRLEANGTGTGAYKFYLNEVLRIQYDASNASYDSATVAGNLLFTYTDTDYNYVIDTWRSGLISDLGGGGGGATDTTFGKAARGIADGVGRGLAKVMEEIRRPLVVPRFFFPKG